MFASMILTLPAVLAPLLGISTTIQCRFDRVGDPAREEQALTAFTEAIDHYVDLHRRLERPMPALWLTSDPEQMEFVTLALADAIRDARPNAVAGNIFTAEVADVFRFRIRNNLRANNYDPAAMVSATDEDGWITPPPVVVNQPFPGGVPSSIWPSILGTLPELPEDLEYQFVDRDLVLLDVHANLVVDILDLALPVR